jgi:hypothetical protein
MKNIKNNINIYKANQKITKTKKQYGGSNIPDTNLSLSFDDDMLLILTGFNKQKFLNLLQTTERQPKNNNNRIINIEDAHDTSKEFYNSILFNKIILSILKQNGMEKRDNITKVGLRNNQYMLNDDVLTLHI